MIQITKRKATPADLPLLLALRHLTMDEHLEAAGMSSADADHMKRIELAFDSAQILEVDGRPVGLLKLVRGPTDWELLQIQLAPELQGAGVGAALVQAVLDEAGAAGANVHLSVLKTNPARRLYERLGFVLVGENGHAYRMSHHPAQAQAQAQAIQQEARQ